jgi:hypothetical protein
LITVFLIILHIQFCRHAGPLWRDEISSVRVATMPTLKESWRLLGFENHPFFHYLVLRAWCFLGLGATDFGLRVLCLLIGLLIVSALWASAWLFDKSAPLLSLAFFALNRHTLRADALRPHGLALVWLVLAFTFIWQLTFQSQHRLRTITLAVIAAVLSVQTGFLNAPLLVAICSGSIAVLALKKAWRSVALILMVGGISALSLSPYIPMLIRAHSWNCIDSVPHSIGNLAFLFCWVATANNPIVYGVFLALVMGSLALVVIPRLRKTFIDPVDCAGERLVFSAVVCLTAVIGTGGFLWLTGFPVARRYYLPLIAVIALSAAVVAAALRRSTVARLAILVGSILVAFAFVRPTFSESGTKFTNCDLAAAAVTERVKAGDVIILTRFDYGIPFQRYYRGTVPWQSIPTLSDYRLFRWDLVKQAMMETDPIGELLVRVKIALRSGHSVFILGQLGSLPIQPPLPLPPAPSTPYGWNMEAYLANWKEQIAYLISRHALTGQNIPLPDKEPVDQVEKMNVSVVSGWQ